MNAQEKAEHRAAAEEAARSRGLIRLQLLDCSGESGASSYRAYPSGAFGRMNPVILKVGPIAVIDGDLEGLETAKLHYRDANYELHCATAGERQDLKVLVLALAGAGEWPTFEEFYHAPDTTPERIAEVVASLFRDTMQVQGLTLSAARNPFRLYTFTDAARHSRALRETGDAVPTLVRWWERAAELGRTLPTHQMLSHGDLHRRNIVVGSERAYLLDFGRTRAEHALRDFAKLERDIRLFLLPDERGDAGLEETDRMVDERVEGDALPSDSLAVEKAAAAVGAVRAASRLVPLEGWPLEYRVALLAQYIFAAGEERFGADTRRLALRHARRLREEIEALRPELAIPGAEVQAAHRREALWRFAYAFFRLDQLPSGGWSRSLPGWLEALLEGDEGTVTRNPHTRTKGGTDLTATAFMAYLRLQRRLGGDPPGAPGERIARAVLDNVTARIGFEGGVGVGQPGRGQTTVVHVRHTLMGLLVCLKFAEYTSRPPISQIEDMSGYLRKYLAHWRNDTSHPFGTLCALAKVHEMLARGTAPAVQGLDELAELVARVLPEVQEALVQPTGEFEILPRNTCGLACGDFHFRPYSGFWRMERASFLMNLPLLVTEDETRFNESLGAPLLEVCAIQLDEILRDLAPWEGGGKLLSYHRPPFGAAGGRVQDWGLTAELAAELAAALRLPAVRAFVAGDPAGPGRRLRGHDPEALVEELRRGLEATFDAYHHHPLFFRFTTGVSFGSVLGALDELPGPAAVAELDREIDEAAARGATEEDLDALCRSLAAAAFRTHPDGELPRTDALRDLLVDRLAAGEHVPHGREWDRRVAEAREGAVRFFDGPGGAEYAAHSAEPSFHEMVRNTIEMVRTEGDGPRRALDVGCGPGQHAVLLQEAGFKVALADGSLQMLSLAHQALGRPAPAPGDIRRLERLLEHYGEGELDLVFACAVLIHVPRSEVPAILEAFHRLLRPGGALFVNFKIGDHTLVGVGNRFFEYYRDHQVLWRMLEEAGFYVRDLSTRRTGRTLSRGPRTVEWANFICTRERDV